MNFKKFLHGKVINSEESNYRTGKKSLLTLYQTGPSYLESTKDETKLNMKTPNHLTDRRAGGLGKHFSGD